MKSISSALILLTIFALNEVDGEERNITTHEANVTDVPTTEQSGVARSDSFPDPCESANIHHVSGDNIDVYSEDANCFQWNVEEWTGFQSNNGEPLKIVQNREQDEMCIQTRQCGSQFPWYISSTNSSSVLCMTDKLMTGKERCCTGGVQIAVHHCSNGQSVYRIEEPIERHRCGGICLVKDKDKPLQYKHLTATGYHARQWYEELPRSLQDSVVTMTFVIESNRMADFKEVETIEEFRRELVRRWQRQRNPKFQNKNIRNLYGSPETVDAFYRYTFYIVDDDGVGVPANTTEPFLKGMASIDVLADGVSRTYDVTQGITESLVNMPRPTTLAGSTTGAISLNENTTPNVNSASSCSLFSLLPSLAIAITHLYL